MKTSKQNDTKVTKDVLLHSIFQEIADENRETSQSTAMDDLIPKPEKTSSKKGAFLNWIFIVIVVTGIGYLWFYTVTEVTQDKEVQIKSDSHTAPTTDQIVQIKEEPELPDVLKEKPKKLLVIEVTDPNQPIEKSPLKEEGPKTEREKAKEALLLQMQ